MVRLAGQPMKVSVMRNAKIEEFDLPAQGFQFDDEIVGTTAEAQGNPFVMKNLPDDTFRDPEHEGKDFFEYRRRMRHLAGSPVVLEVNRSGESHLIFVPQAYQYTL